MVPPLVASPIVGTALAHVPGHVVITDADLKILYLNRPVPGHEAEPEALVGTGYLDLLTAEQAQTVQAGLERAHETGRPQEHETVVEPPTGGRQWYSTQITWYETDDGAAGMMCVLTEITPQKQAEQHAETLRKELIGATHRASMAEIATGVLHNVGNVLTSVNVSAETLIKELDRSRLHLLGRTVQMLDEHAGHLAAFIDRDPKGRRLPLLLSQLDQALTTEHQDLRREVGRLAEHVALMRSIVEAQQTIAKVGNTVEPALPRDLVEQTLSMFRLDFEARFVDLVTELPDIGKVVLDKQATLQVLSNLVRNAIEALEGVELPRRLVVRTAVEGDGIWFEVEDTGMGIAPQHAERLFDHGFSTKRNGHGFGLHASLIAARTMNGTLQAYSKGVGHGARFRLTLPRIMP